MRGNGPPNIDGMVTLKIDNIPYNSTVDELRRTFERYFATYVLYTELQISIKFFSARALTSCICNLRCAAGTGAHPVYCL